MTAPRARVIAPGVSGRDLDGKPWMVTRCKHCGATLHMARNCPTRRTRTAKLKRKRRPGPRRCGVCGSLEHDRRKCPGK